MAPEQKTEALLVRMSETEATLLQELSEHTGLTKADVIRQLLRREHAQVIAPLQQKASKSTASRKPKRGN